MLFTVFSFSTQSNADKNMMSVGTEGKSDDVTRVIRIKMYDNYFEPNSFNFEAEETVRFEVEKTGNQIVAPRLLFVQPAKHFSILILY